MPSYTKTDWYRFPHYYDIIFDPDTGKEADFIEALLERHGPARAKSSRARILEPACGTGRLMVELARRGHHVTGFDAKKEMLVYARKRTSAESTAVQKLIRLEHARMESFREPGPFDLAHCLLSTFKHLLTEEHALEHLRSIARVLVPGGVYALGVHLTDYTRRRTDREVWRGERDGVRVLCETITRPADAKTRLEWLRNRMSVRHRGTRAVERLETEWQCRTYNIAELETLIAAVPELEPVACYDFTHNIDVPRGFDDAQEDLVVVLRKRSARRTSVE